MSGNISFYLNSNEMKNAGSHQIEANFTNQVFQIKALPLELIFVIFANLKNLEFNQFCLVSKECNAWVQAYRKVNLKIMVLEPISLDIRSWLSDLKINATGDFNSNLSRDIMERVDAKKYLRKRKEMISILEKTYDHVDWVSLKNIKHCFPENDIYYFHKNYKISDYFYQLARSVNKLTNVFNNSITPLENGELESFKIQLPISTFISLQQVVNAVYYFQNKDEGRVETTENPLSIILDGKLDPLAEMSADSGFDEYMALNEFDKKSISVHNITPPQSLMDVIARVGSLEGIKFLLDNHAVPLNLFIKVFISYYQYYDDRSALIDYLCKAKVNINATDDSGNTCLNYLFFVNEESENRLVILTKQLENIKKNVNTLVRNGLDLTHANNKCILFNIFDNFSENCSEHTLICLFEIFLSYKINLEIKNKLGFSILKHISFALNYHDYPIKCFALIELLIKNGADFLDFYPDDYYFLKIKGDLTVKYESDNQVDKLILKYNPYNPGIQLEGGFESTAREFIFKQKAFEGLGCRFENLKNLKQNNQPDINYKKNNRCRDDFGRSFLHYAVNFDSLPVIQHYLSNDSQHFKVKDKNRVTPLQLVKPNSKAESLLQIEPSS